MATKQIASTLRLGFTSVCEYPNQDQLQFIFQIKMFKMCVHDLSSRIVSDENVYSLKLSPFYPEMSVLN